MLIKLNADLQKEIDGMYINDGKVSGADFWGLEKALNNGFRPQHLYITNGEEIKEGDWYLFNNQVFLAGISTWEIKDRETSNYKKIILTTDTKLIADGIHEIDDTFLQWFIENPTCEYVGVEKQMLCTNCGREHCDNLRCNGYEDKPYYEIIIPLEEPKQVICRDKFDRVIQDGYYVDVQNDGVHKVYRKEDGQLYFKPYGEEERVSNYFSNDLILIPYSTKLIMDLKKEIADKKQDVFYNKKQEEPKQETVEEAAERFYPPTTTDLICSPKLVRDAFIAGGNHMAERMYNEEESIQKIIDYVDFQFNTGGELNSEIKKWFEQFKKK
jgi:hypothetical protein